MTQKPAFQKPTIHLFTQLKRIGMAFTQTVQPNVLTGGDLSSLCGPPLFPPGTLDRDEWTFDINLLADDPAVTIQATLNPPGPGPIRMRVLDPSNTEIDCEEGPQPQVIFNAITPGTYTIVIFNIGSSTVNYEFTVTSQNSMSGPNFLFPSICDVAEQLNACT